MALNGPQIGALTQILVTAFSRSELTILVRVKLNVDLAAEVSTDDAWRNVAYDLIDTLDRRGQAIDLIRAIREERPRDTTLISFCDPLLSQTNGAAQQIPTDALRKAVAAFNNVFGERIEYFKYLNAYKVLHDVLHELQSFHFENRGSRGRAKGGSQPTACGRRGVVSGGARPYRRRKREGD